MIGHTAGPKLQQDAPDRRVVPLTPCGSSMSTSRPACTSEQHEVVSHEPVGTEVMWNTSVDLPDASAPARACTMPPHSARSRRVARRNEAMPRLQKRARTVKRENCEEAFKRPGMPLGRFLRCVYTTQGVRRCMLACERLAGGGSRIFFDLFTPRGISVHSLDLECPLGFPCAPDEFKGYPNGYYMPPKRPQGPW